MKNLALCILLLSAQALAASPDCYPYVPATPQKNAAGTIWQFEKGQYGEHLYWHCENFLGIAKPYGYMCSFEDKGCDDVRSIQWLKKVFLLPDSQKLATVQTAWDANQKYDCDNPAVTSRTDYVGRICKEHNGIYALHKTEWLATSRLPRWQVKPLATGTKSPAYSFPNGALGTVKAQVSFWVWCDINRSYLKSGSNAWMHYDQTDNVVLCSRTQ